jgi:hypothetical protein
VVLDGGRKSAAENKKKLAASLHKKAMSPLKLFFANSLSNT